MEIDVYYVPWDTRPSIKGYGMYMEKIKKK